ncbi:MAG: hypothetical protein IPN44_07830 [Flavobacteriales bacterium]|nr:hypothetical protein [Flavobacteriales bacterium]
MSTQNKSTPKNAHTNAGIEVEGGFIPEHADKAKLKADGEGADPAADPLVAKALTKDQPEQPEITDREALADEDLLSIGIQTGQTARGSYSTDQSTGGGAYHDHRAGQFGVDPVAQPGNDEDVEPDPVPKGF